MSPDIFTDLLTGHGNRFGSYKFYLILIALLYGQSEPVSVPIKALMDRDPGKEANVVLHASEVVIVTLGLILITPIVFGSRACGVNINVLVSFEVSQILTLFRLDVRQNLVVVIWTKIRA